MIIFFSNSNDPCQNLATEEFLLKNSREDYLFIYRNRPCVVIGKHQIAIKEIDPHYTQLNNIQITRRLSGGGAVYHDEGNLNFSFIQTIKPQESISYQRLTEPLYQFLKSLGIDTTLTQRNDFILEGKKISGSAMHVYKERVMAHCTLLVESDLIHLSRSLHGHPERFEDKSIRSVRSEVMNLAESNPGWTMELLYKQLNRFFIQGNIRNRTYTLNESDYKIVNQISEKKYASREWVYGYSPRYNYRHSFEINRASQKFQLAVEKGIIKEVSFEPGNDLNNDIPLIFKNLAGTEHSYQGIKIYLEKSMEPRLADPFLKALV